MNPAYLALLLLAAGSSIVGTILMIKQLRHSPEGYEDENGFHFGRYAEEMIRVRAHDSHAEVAETQHAA